METNSRTDPGVPGSARYRRLWELKGKKQAEIGAMCRPPISQTGIYKFETAAERLTWSKAQRMAPAYFPVLWGTKNAEHRHEAVLRVYQLWFATVAAYGSETLKREALDIAGHIGASLWQLPDRGLFAARVNEAGAQPVVQVQSAATEGREDGRAAG